MFFVQSHGGGPEVRDGQYLLTSHGAVLRVLTEEQYHWYRALVVRGFSGHWMLFSLVPALFWLRESSTAQGPEAPVQP